MEINDNEIIKIFLNRNHIQGHVKSNLKLGLFLDNELVSLMLFDHNEGRKNMCNDSWNISRFCSKLNSSIIGGASKIFNHFVENYNPKRIISYADKDWSDGDLYLNLGFKCIDDLNPDYKYIINKKRVNKSKFRKSNLDTNLSESQYMENEGINKIWDCGKLKFEIKF